MTDRHRFHTALQHAPVRLFAQDRDLRYTWIVNPAVDDPSAILGKADAETLPAESAARLTEVKAEALRTGRSVRREVQPELPTGPRIFDLWVEPTRDADGLVDGVACTALDITERRQVEEALSIKTTQLNFALASTGVGMWLNTLPLGKLDWDQRTRELFCGALRWIRSAGRATYDDHGEATRFDDINYDIKRQPNPEPSLRQRACRIGLGEDIEEARHELLCDSHPVVRH